MEMYVSLYVLMFCSVYGNLSRREVYMVEAAGLFSASVGIWLHHMPYITCTAGLLAALASQSQHVTSVAIYTSVCLSVCLSVTPTIHYTRFPATSPWTGKLPKQVVVMEFGKRHDTTVTTDF